MIFKVGIVVLLILLPLLAFLIPPLKVFQLIAIGAISLFFLPFCPSSLELGCLGWIVIPAFLLVYISELIVFLTVYLLMKIIKNL